MKHSPLLTLAASLLTALTLPAIAADTTPVKSCCTVDTTQTAMPPATFAKTLAMVNLTEIRIGAIAQANAVSPAVKKFGAYMVTSHTEMNTWLTALAAQQHIPLPTALDKKSAATVAKLSALHGQAFDTTYIPAMVAGHTQVLAMVRNFCSSCSDPAFKKFAAKVEPIIATHLKRAQKLQTAMQKSGELPPPAAQ